MRPLAAFILIALPALLGGCDAATPAESPSDRPPEASDVSAADRTLELAPGQAMDLDDGALVLRFVEVAGDSRCPADVVCVWQGEAVVALETVHAGVERAWGLSTNAEDPAVQVGPYRIVLQGLSPYPRSYTPIPSDAYRATLRVSGVR